MRVITEIRARPNRGVGTREQHDILSTRYRIEDRDGSVGEPLSMKELYAEAHRRGEKIEFVDS
jgi:hypothetical protein